MSRRKAQSRLITEDISVVTTPGRTECTFTQLGLCATCQLILRDRLPTLEGLTSVNAVLVEADSQVLFVGGNLDIELKNTRAKLCIVTRARLALWRGNSCLSPSRLGRTQSVQS